MKNWMTRLFALVAVAAVMGSALMVGCGGGGDTEETTTNTVTTTKPADELTKPE